MPSGSLYASAAHWGWRLPSLSEQNWGHNPYFTQGKRHPFSDERIESDGDGFIGHKGLWTQSPNAQRAAHSGPTGLRQPSRSEEAGELWPMLAPTSWPQRLGRNETGLTLWLPHKGLDSGWGEERTRQPEEDKQHWPFRRTECPPSHQL